MAGFRALDFASEHAYRMQQEDTDEIKPRQGRRKMGYTPLRSGMTTTERATRAAQANARKNGNRRKGFGHPTTSDIDYSAAEVELMMAMESYKRESGRMFPTWQEVHRVLISLGYYKPDQGPQDAA